MTMSLLNHRQGAAGSACTESERRAIHFVGSLPPEIASTDRAAMQWILDHTGAAELTALPGDRDSRWIIDWLDRLGERESFDLVLVGDSSDYRSMPAYRLRRGEQLDAADVAPGRAAEVPAALAARRQLSALALPPHQVSMPAPLDLALFAFGVPAAVLRRLPAGAAVQAVRAVLRHLPVFVKAVVDEITKIVHVARAWHEDVVIQLESPAVLVAYDGAPRAAWPMLHRLLAHQIVQVVTAAPSETRFVLHTWCRGDLGHKPISHLRELAPMVKFANAVTALLDRARRPIPPMQIALCDGIDPPSRDPQRYAPLRALRQDIPVIAGLVDEHHPETSAVALELAEQALERPVAAISAACGLGRRTPEQAAANVALAWRLTAHGGRRAYEHHAEQGERR
ncbi:hypothetical protein [Amycolatopsis magusensis]|uniref:hypothetical protein n=1 Tax=Amycolatopsis magusensis TaxID=882444 RepID=UPI00378BC97D